VSRSLSARGPRYSKSLQLLRGDAILLDGVVSNGKIGAHGADEIARDGGR